MSIPWPQTRHSRLQGPIATPSGFKYNLVTIASFCFSSLSWPPSKSVCVCLPVFMFVCLCAHSVCLPITTFIYCAEVVLSRHGGDSFHSYRGVMSTLLWGNTADDSGWIHDFQRRSESLDFKCVEGCRVYIGISVQQLGDEVPASSFNGRLMLQGISRNHTK